MSALLYQGERVGMVVHEGGTWIVYSLSDVEIARDPWEGVARQRAYVALGLAYTSEIAYVQNGRPVYWREVTNEHLIAALSSGWETWTPIQLRFAAREWERRMGKPFEVSQ